MSEDAVAAPAVPAEQRIRSGANWFYWIAALSLINSFTTLTGSAWGFVVGLGVTQFIDGFASAFESRAASAVGVGLSAAVAGVVALVGLFARRHRWLYLTGMILFGLDGLLFLLFQDWLGLGFHGLVLFFMTPGLRAFGELGSRREAGMDAAPEPIPAAVEPA